MRGREVPSALALEVPSVPVVEVSAVPAGKTPSVPVLEVSTRLARVIAVREDSCVRGSGGVVGGVVPGSLLDADTSTAAEAFKAALLPLACEAASEGVGTWSTLDVAIDT